MDDDKDTLQTVSFVPELKSLEKLNSDRRESDITMSLSDYELQKIKEEVEAGLRGFEAEENLPSSFLSPQESRPFDIPLTEEEFELLERCTVGSPGMFCQAPRVSVCSASLDILADSLIRDLEELDSATRNAGSLEQEVTQTSGNLNTRTTEASSPGVINPSSLVSAGFPEKISVSEARAQKVDEKLDLNQNSGTVKTMDISGSFQNENSESTSIASQKDVEYRRKSEEELEEGEDSDSPPASVDSGLPVRDVVSSQHRYFVVVAIDFGTTFSGYAFSFTRDGESVHMMRRWEGGDPGVSNQKTPTTLLLKPDGSFHSFGFGARDFYHDLEHDEAKKWMYFEKFKMALHTDKDLNKDTEIKAANGKAVKAVLVFAHALKFFKEHVLEELSDQSATQILEEDIQWVLTVPAIWKAPAKQFMRAAAYEAGLTTPETPDRLLIALEPEAASIYCRKLRLRDCAWEESKRKSTITSYLEGQVADEFEGKTRYVVVDCGGGTVDLTVHELDTDNGTLSELHRGTGGACGAIGVEAEFEKLLKKIFGKDFIEQFKTKRPAGWVDLIIAFEAKKRTASPNKTNPLNVSMPYSFIEYYKKHKSSSIESAVKKFNNPGVKWSSQGMLRIAPEMMKELFNPVLKEIVQHTQQLIGKDDLRGVKYLFLVGGFAESPLLQATIRENFGSEMKIIIPQDVGLTILKGAVLFGLDPSVVRVRRAPMTYGVGVLNRYIPGKHPKSKLIKKNGIEWCTDVFDKFVVADQAVKLGERVTRSYATAKPGQSSTVITVFCTENDEVLYISDAGVKKCGQLRIEMPTVAENNPKKPRELRASMIFGDTEIKVMAVDVLTGKDTKATIDFLSN